jgi:hypothetical protein
MTGRTGDRGRGVPSYGWPCAHPDRPARPALRHLAGGQVIRTRQYPREQERADPGPGVRGVFQVREYRAIWLGQTLSIYLAGTRSSASRSRLGGDLVKLVVTAEPQPRRKCQRWELIWVATLPR